MKIVVLVIASNELPIYKFFKDSWLTYYNHIEDIKVFFVYGKDSHLTHTPCENDIIFDHIEEKKSNIIIKTLEAIEYINKNYQYDVFVRTNLSTFWNFNALLKNIDFFSNSPHLHGLKTADTNPEYILGAGIITSRNSIEEFLQLKQQIINDPMRIISAEDKFISSGFIKLGYELRAIKRFSLVVNCLETFNKSRIKKFVSRANERFYVRVKNTFNREIDKIVHRQLCKLIYGKEIIET